MAAKKTLLELLGSSSGGLESLSVKELAWMASYVGVPSAKQATAGDSKRAMIALLREQLGDEDPQGDPSRGSVKRRLKERISMIDDGGGLVQPKPLLKGGKSPSTEKRDNSGDSGGPPDPWRSRRDTTDSLAEDVPALKGKTPRPQTGREVLGSFSRALPGDAAANEHFIPEVANPLAHKSPPLPRSKNPITPTGLKTGNLELSKDKLADLMSEMLKDIDAPIASDDKVGLARGTSVKAGGPATLESVMAKVEMRQKLPAHLRKKDGFELEVDTSHRATMMINDYVATEDDLASQMVRNSEIEQLEEGAEALYDDEDADVTPMIQPSLHIAVQVFPAKAADAAMTGTFELALSCAEVQWTVTRTRNQFADFLKDLCELPKFSGATEGFPAAAGPKMLPKEAASAQHRDLATGFELWLNDLLTSVDVQTVMDVEAFDDFLDCFWYVKEAKRNSPPIINFLAHLGRSRLNAEQTLKGKPPGTYLIRGKTGEAGQYVISTIHEEGFWHGVVVVDDSKPSYTLLGSNLPHRTLEALLEFYQKHPYSKSEGKLWYLGSFCGVPRTKTE
mmetsp:Transcript_10617/g.31856  ORF Transcript_10617/g.31856 Transcript_10617/m.31856 type:complete len:563 (+) Transcript_10617:246-1934(+)